MHIIQINNYVDLMSLVGAFHLLQRIFFVLRKEFTESSVNWDGGVDNSKIKLCKSCCLTIN